MDLAPDRDLSAQELVELVRDIHASGVWQEHVRADPQQRTYHLLAENDHLSVWVLCWMPGQSTGFHDHAGSQVGLMVARGALAEDHLTLAGVRTHTLEAGEEQRGGPGYIHNVRHHAGAPAVSIHAYSPPLTDAGVYREVGGALVRVAEAGDAELVAS